MTKARLKEKYSSEIILSLKEKMNCKSVMQVPKLQKICINKGVGAGVADKKLIELGIEELTAITGQKAIRTVAKKSISNFKLREGMPIGVKVTLRDNIMYEFFDRLISISLPRIRNFWGLKSKGFDGKGNYTLGIEEQIIFPEISIDKVSKLTGMSITFVTNARNDKDAYLLLKSLGMPFQELKD